MIKNYLIIAKRFLLNKPIFTILNILGLTVGITAAALIFHYVTFEESFDTYHLNHENVYRLTYGRLQENGDDVEFASACPVIAPLLKDNFTEIEQIARMAVRDAVFAYEDKSFKEDKIYYAEQSIFDILYFNIIKGNVKDVLSNPNNVVISESIANKYFGNVDPVGKRLRLNKKEDYIVQAVFEDVPKNSHLKPDILMSFPNLAVWRGADYLESWGHTGAFTYLTLSPEANPRELEKKFIEFTDSQIGEFLKHYKTVMYFNLQPISSIHLKSKLLQEQEPAGDENTVDFLLIIGIFILIIAWVNYINLSTSRSMERAREVGVRKVVGAARWNLVKQFYIEAALVNLVGLLFAIGLIELLHPAFSNLTGTPISNTLWGDVWFFKYLAGVFIIGTIFTGLYPVFALSAYKPVKVLKGSLVGATRGVNLRKVLVVFQIMISIILITGTFTVFMQLKHLQSQELGFKMNKTLVVNMPKAIDSTIVQGKQVFIQEVERLAGVKGVAFSTEVPGRKIWWDNGAIYKAGQDASKGKNYMIMGIDDRFIDQYGMEFMKGRNFSKEFTTDKDALILNETAMRYLEFESPEDALSGQVNYWGKIYNVVGVLKDYKHESPKAVPEPQIFRYLPDESRFGCFSVSLENELINENIKKIEKIWVKLFEGNPYEYFFLDTYYDEQYKADRKFGKVFGLFSFMAIFITCLGLFGLSLYTANTKTKEIGIRKVLGARVFNIVSYISKEYIVLLTFAVILAIPGLIWAIKYWLNNFPEKMEISVWLFILPVFMVFIITILSVSAYTFRAARTNPVNSLKYE